MTNIYPIHVVYLPSLTLERLLLRNKTANPFLDLTSVFFRKRFSFRLGTATSVNSGSSSSAADADTDGSESILERIWRHISSSS